VRKHLFVCLKRRVGCGGTKQKTKMLSRCETAGQWVALDGARVCIVHSDAVIQVEDEQVAGKDVLVWAVKDEHVQFVALCKDKLLVLDHDSVCTVVQPGTCLPYSRFTSLADYARSVQQTCIDRATILLGDDNDELASLVLNVKVGFGVEIEDLIVHEEDEDLIFNEEDQDNQDQDNQDQDNQDQDNQDQDKQDQDNQDQDKQESSSEANKQGSNLQSKQEESSQPEKQEAKATKKSNKKDKKATKHATKQAKSKKAKSKKKQVRSKKPKPSGFSPNDVTHIVVTAPDAVDYTVLAKCVYDELETMVDKLGVVEQTLVRDPSDTAPRLTFAEAETRLAGIQACIKEDAIARALEEAAKLQNQLWHSDRTLGVKKFIALPNWINNERIAGLACHSVAITEDWQVMAPHQAGIVMASIHRFIGKLEDASQDLTEGKRIYVDVRHFFRPMEEGSDELVPAGMLYKVRGFFTHDFCVKFWGQEEEEDQQEEEEEEEEEHQDDQEDKE